MGKHAFLLEVVLNDEELAASNEKRAKLVMQARTPQEIVEFAIGEALNMKLIESHVIAPATPVVEEPFIPGI